MIGAAFAAFTAVTLDAIGRGAAATKCNVLASLANFPIWWMGLLLARVAERYIRPPLHATEPSSRRAAAWRFRLAFAVLVLAILVGLFFLYRALTGSPGEGSPSVAPAPPVPLERERQYVVASYG